MIHERVRYRRTPGCALPQADGSKDEPEQVHRVEHVEDSATEFHRNEAIEPAQKVRGAKPIEKPFDDSAHVGQRHVALTKDTEKATNVPTIEQTGVRGIHS